MSDEITAPDLEEQLRQIYKLVQYQDKKIAELQTRLKSDNRDENSTVKFFDIYLGFIRMIKEQSLTISRKYRTENSVNYVDAPYPVYRDFISEHLEQGELRTFKEFLQDFRLVEPGVFGGSGLYVQTVGNGKIRAVRIRADLVRWITDES